MNLSYPITYSAGSIALVNTAALSQTQHLLDTIAGERILAPDFGIPLDILYSTGIPQVLAERARLVTNQVTNAQTQVEVVEYKSGKLTLKLTLATGQTVTADYATP